jgi:hypothetical protein
MLSASSQPRKVLPLFLLLLAPAFAQVHVLANRSPHALSAMAIQFTDKKGDVFNILWVLVFGFATLNILGLVARRFEPNRNQFSFGEALAVMVVMVSVGLLGWELLTVFKIFPIKLHPH